MELKDTIRTYFETLGAKEGCKVFPHLVVFTIKTEIGACNVKVSLKNSTVFVDFFQNPNAARNVFGDQRVDMVGSEDGFFEQIKKHFNFIFASITENCVS